MYSNRKINILIYYLDNPLAIEYNYFSNTERLVGQVLNYIVGSFYPFIIFCEIVGIQEVNPDILLTIYTLLRDPKEFPGQQRYIVLSASSECTLGSQPSGMYL
ncbi:hypothetical protein ATANTOWER_014031 [Ataeniobius toweri]|uniref:Uncharacterized protein n=1 Tax=Ataeniobius toweri TaxID=208326 RepID=A0ABU7BSI8_9TELE|nr:hypothetical protein [Ataeniobius toweri]